MDIITVEIQEGGNYFVNGKHYVSKNTSHRHSIAVQEWIDAGNTPDPYVGPTAMETWVEDMARSDTALLSRAMEDMLDGMPDKSGVAQITLDRLQAKKDLRATKP